MDEILKHSGERLKELSKQCPPEKISDIADVLFSDGINLFRIAHFMAFAKSMIEDCPEKRCEIYEQVYMGIYRNMRFE